MQALTPSLAMPGSSARATVTDDAALQLADRLIADTHQQGAHGLLYRENLAIFLYNAVGEHGIESLLQSPGRLSIESIREHTPSLTARRWVNKLERDLAHPFTDREVIEHVQRLEKKLLREVLTLRAWSHGEQFRLLINGSLCKGRMGANSDIDASVITEDAEFRKRLLPHFRTLDKENLSLYVMPQDPEVSQFIELMSGPRLDLGDGEALLSNPHLLTETWLSALRRRGYEVSSNYTVSAVDAHPERQREAVRWMEKFWETSRPDGGHDLAWKVEQQAAHVACSLLPNPLFGPAVRWALEKLVPSTVEGR